MGLDRDMIVGGKVTVQERKIIEEAAKASHVTVSEYVRSAALTAACLDGNVAALKYVGKMALTKVLAQARELMPERERIAL